LKCGKKGREDPTAPAISDSVWFGITSYQMYNNYDKGFFDLSYRAYKLVYETIGSDRMTKLTVFLLRESDYQAWSKTCIRCYPPTEFAINGTLCNGYQCTGEKNYLGWKNGEYRLMVAFPEICNAYNDLCYDDMGPSDLKNGFTKQLVNVKIYPTMKLPKTTTKNAARRAALDSVDDDDSDTSSPSAIIQRA